MNPALTTAVTRLRTHAAELRRMGVLHAGIFGSVARGEDQPSSDLDVLIELDPDAPVGIFEYARLRLYLTELLGEQSDIANRKTLKPLLRDRILRDAIDAF